MGVKWTKEQQKVIDTKDCNLLVSAAAGSGKTAVLVERIIRMITDPKNPVDIDRLLIVTFTRAAAGEMRERIRLAIEKKLEENEADEHLRRQSMLLHSAQITTIDSFCSYVVRNYFHMIDLDPSYRVAEEGELRMMQGDVISRVLREAYEEGGEAFHEFVECFSTGKTDEGIADMISRLYTFSVSYPYPEEWLNSCRSAYQIAQAEELEKASWMQLIKDDIRKNLEEAEELVQAAMAVCREEDGPYFYEDALALDLGFLKKMMETCSFEEWQQKMEGLSFARLSAKKDSQVSEEARETVKNLRQQEKDILEGLKEQYFTVSLEQAARYMQRASGPVNVLIDLTIRFAQAFAEKKREKNILDYSDLEHFALQILIRHTEEKDEKTQAAVELSERFYEIMIDEYQDSNFVQEKLLTAVSRMEEGRNNIFMVGDVKQSIYRFRLARPDLFMEKYHRYAGQENGCMRIDLHKNFRSREEILSGINFLFYQIMGESLGGVAYDEEAALYPGAVFPEYEGGFSENGTELLLTETDEEEWQEMEAGENARELEARAVAAKIREIAGNYPILDKETGTYRTAQYGDMVILLRSLSGWAETFKKILDSQGIPASVTTKTGYFSAQEVVTVLNYLRILDNPLQDIPLTGVLMNLPDAFTMQEMAAMRCAGREAEVPTLYECLVLYAEQETENPKARRFLETWRRLHDKVPYTPVHELLWDIYEETGLLEYYRASVAGEQQKANLLMLFEKARDYESTSYRGLFNFVRYIESLQKYQIDFGEANIVLENDNTVKIMSIHKSKGLEFPVVFVSGLGKLFNQQDSRAALAMHPDLGVGADWIDPVNRTKTPTLLKKAVQRQIQLENLGEELRILYVALTRAKEKVYLTGCISRMEKRLENLEVLKKQKDTKISYGKLVKARNYLDWILPALARHACMDAIYRQYDRQPWIFHPLHDADVKFSVSMISPVLLTLEAADSRSTQEIKREELLKMDGIGEQEKTERYRQMEERFSWEYPWREQEKIPVKITVSEVKRMQPVDEESMLLYEERKEEDSYEEIVPAFIQEQEPVLTGARRGTAYHRVFECLDFTHAEEEGAIREQLIQMRDSGKLSLAAYETVKPRDILKFTQSPIGSRMGKAQAENRLFREQPFMIEVPADRIREDFSGDESILVQGIIDAFFMEDDHLILVDYKTDRVFHGNGRELVEKYKIQLDYYGEALERIMGQKVSEKYVYSVDLQKAILVV